jgi:hypothetical protein
MRNPQPMIEAMARLAGGPKSLTNGINMELYLQQAQAYDKMLESSWDRFLQGMAVMNTDHPFASVRCRELKKWGESDEFHRLMKGLDDDAQRPKCPGCSRAIEDGWKFCRSCGKSLVKPSDNHSSGD